MNTETKMSNEKYNSSVVQHEAILVRVLADPVKKILKQPLLLELAQSGCNKLKNIENER